FRKGNLPCAVLTRLLPCRPFGAQQNQIRKIMTTQSDIGLNGLAVMGENLVLNMESKGFSVAIFNRTTTVTEKFAATRGKGKNIFPATTLEDFVRALKRP